MSLKIEKTTTYGWRRNVCDSWFATVTGWNVVNSETGEVVYGGFSNGSSYKSTQPYLPRRKDAKAFIAGWMGETMEKMDREQENFYDEGIHFRQDFNR